MSSYENIIWTVFYSLLVIMTAFCLIIFFKKWLFDSSEVVTPSKREKKKQKNQNDENQELYYIDYI